MESHIEALINSWRKRNISGFYCANKKEAADLMLQIIPASASVGISGSVTLNELGIVALLESRGKNRVFNQYQAELTPDESLKLRREGAQADYYLASANAVSQKGELVFLSAYGNRSAGVSYAKNVVIVCGANKITPDLSSAIKRAREYAAPLNCKRLKNWDPSRPMCCQVLIIEAEVLPERLKVIMVGEELGF
ncbi:MAG: lactate utilization protein [Candidatus Omnitrophica bacterium]|nr:lactate utilization protein [Candidatus Omnitrophota bacterium]MBL7151853.1 lactate utilization protein [Candidatus Omnitrophota bacterium]MBL7210607.1 lactate utilization protein [Candidatus Omnitrophota bacterium]